MINPNELFQGKTQEEIPTITPAHLSEKIQILCAQLASEKNLFEDPGLYVPANGSYTQYSQQVFDLAGAIQEFLDSDKKVLLLLGGSGSGKSLFGQTLMRQMAKDYRSGNPIPLFISLPTLRNPKAFMQEVLQQQGFTPDEMKQLQQSQRFCLVLDAYDEINQLENLYILNKLDQWQAKVIISCRTDYLVNVESYRRYFMPYRGENALTNVFQELYVAPFVPQQINLYIQQYLQVKGKELQEEIQLHSQLTKEWLEAKTYHNWIEQVPGLKPLVQTPFLLKITMEVLPSIVADYQQAQDSQERFNMTSVKLYDAFFKRWITRQENKLVGLGQSPSRTFSKDCLAFAKALALKMHQKNILQVTFEEASDIGDMFGDSADITPAAKEWSVFFSDKMVPEDKGNENRQKARIQARKACPLRQVGPNTFTFLHASLLNYLVTLSIVGPQPTPQSRQVQAQPEEIIATSLAARTKDAKGHWRIGKFAIWNKIDHQEAALLLREEGLKVEFQPGENKTKFILGQGQYGKSAIAQNVENNRIALVKKIKGERAIRNSKEEAEMQLQLNGLSNLMPIWYYVEIKNTKGEIILYQFMPLASFENGKLLRDALKLLQDNPLKQKILLHIAKGLLTGIKNMHGRRIYHLDIKPANFVIDYRGVIYLIDFGCARRKYDNSQDNKLIGGNGDRNYIAPDRLRAHPKKEAYDAAKADAWAVGVTLLELVAGDYPFGDADIGFRPEDWNEAYFKRTLQTISQTQGASFAGVMELITKLVDVNPDTRLTAQQALSLPIFQNQALKMSDEQAKLAFIQLKSLSAPDAEEDSELDAETQRRDRHLSSQAHQQTSSAEDKGYTDDNNASPATHTRSVGYFNSELESSSRVSSEETKQSLSVQSVPLHPGTYMDPNDEQVQTTPIKTSSDNDNNETSLSITTPPQPMAPASKPSAKIGYLNKAPSDISSSSTSTSSTATSTYKAVSTTLTKPTAYEPMPVSTREENKMESTAPAKKSLPPTTSKPKGILSKVQNKLKTIGEKKEKEEEKKDKKEDPSRSFGKP